MRPASTFSIIQLSNSRAEKIYKDAGADYVILDIRGILDIAK